MIAAIEFTDVEQENIQHVAGCQERVIRVIGINQQMRPAVRREILRRIEDAVHEAEKELDDDAIVHSGVQQPCGF